MRKKSENKFFVNWRNTKGNDCKAIGPATKCFCDHRYKEHDFYNPVNGMIKCKTPQCPCKHFYYIPVHGSQDFKCICKHSYTDHKKVTKACNNCACKKFDSSWSCSCKLKFPQH